MSKKGRKPRSDATDATEKETTVWIKTEPHLSGGYMVTLEVGDDSWALTPYRSARYGTYLLSTVARAEYDAAIFQQMSHTLGKTVDDPQERLRTIAQVLGDVRKDRPPLDGSEFPLNFAPIVKSRDQQPAIEIARNPNLARGAAFGVTVAPKPLGLWSVEDAREHALTAMMIPQVADLDSAYRSSLIGIIGVEAGLAENIVAHLADYR